MMPGLGQEPPKAIRAPLHPKIQIVSHQPLTCLGQFVLRCIRSPLRTSPSHGGDTVSGTMDKVGSGRRLRLGGAGIRPGDRSRCNNCRKPRKPREAVGVGIRRTLSSFSRAEIRGRSRTWTWSSTPPIAITSAPRDEIFCCIDAYTGCRTAGLINGYRPHVAHTRCRYDCVYGARIENFTRRRSAPADQGQSPHTRASLRSRLSAVVAATQRL